MVAFLDFLAHSATDILDIVGHPWNTGDGPGVAVPPGGASGGLDVAVDVWIIKVDADHVKLADSQAHALAGTAIDITTTMSGVLALGLPYRRTTTYVANVSQVKAADLNALAAAEVGIKHGVVPFVLPASSFTKYSGAAVLTVGQLVGVGTFTKHLPFAPGTTIHALTWGYNRGGSGTMTLTLAECNPLPAFSTAGAFAPQITVGTGYAKTDYLGADINTAGGHRTLPANSGWTLQVDHTDAANVFGGVLIWAARE